MEVTAVECSRKNLAYAKRQNRDLGIAGVTYVLADLAQLKPAHFPQLFDIIVANDVLHYMEKPMQGWQAMASVLRPKGIMSITVHNKRAVDIIKSVRSMVASSINPPLFDDGIQICWLFKVVLHS